VTAQIAVLIIDVGLTNCKVSLFGTDGQLLGQAGRRHPTVNPAPGMVEQDPLAWWTAIREAAQELREKWSAATEVAAIGVTGHMHGLVLADRHGQPLTSCWTLFDRRAEGEAAALRRELGPAAYRITGGRLEAYTPAAKVRWLARRRPELLTRDVVLLAPKDVVRCLLGGDAVTDPVDAAGTVLFDLAQRAWSDDLLAVTGAGRLCMPEVRQSWATGGQLSRPAADALGLRAGIPLIVGAGDDVEALGAGVVRPGQVLEHIGTTGALIACIAQPIFDPTEAVEVYPHVLPDVWLLGGATNAAGRSLDWASRLVPSKMGSALPLAYPRPGDSPRPPVYLPFILGERGMLWDSRASAAFLGLQERHGPQDLARAVYEGVAFSLKELLRAVNGLGAQPQQIISGTPLTQRAWAQMRADVYGLPLYFSTASDPTGLGTAMLALVHMGVFPSLGEAVESCCRLTECIAHDPRQAAAYDESFEIYAGAVAACRPLFSMLAGIDGGAEA
jgi:xylulokinase